MNVLEEESGLHVVCVRNIDLLQILSIKPLCFCLHAAFIVFAPPRFIYNYYI